MYIKVNEITIYYEKKGFGRPLIMLHGNGESHDIYDVISESLKDNFEVYLIDSRCHGKSQKNVDISYDIMTSDVKVFIDQLDLNNPLLFGFSDGGIVGLLLSIKYPFLLSHLIIAGANLSPKGFLPEVLSDMKKMYEKTKDPLYKMMIDEPDIMVEDLKKIQSKTLILVGSDDVISLSHTMLIHEHIKTSLLHVFEGYHHDDYIIHQDMMKPYIIEFLKN